ncbi:Uncharacterised protein [Vibrio cholerae]|nr:Uncharacterised protein [Vibrio cholerae]CSB23689.1 Uncharacterised protein [Vibrio cholerae]CSB53830.1 Uncharacterised protein [Vibrio cholerae]CSC47520.1 Uncharacterised protein [Vibrio cholerae]
MRALGSIKSIKDSASCSARGSTTSFVGIGIWRLYSLFSARIIECLVTELVANLRCNGLAKACKPTIDSTPSLPPTKSRRFFAGSYPIEAERNNQIYAIALP